MKQCVDPRLMGEYPAKGLAKVPHTLSTRAVCISLGQLVAYFLYPHFSNLCFCLLKLAAVAALCVQYEAEFRPNMGIVVKALSPLLVTKQTPPPVVDS